MRVTQGWSGEIEHNRWAKFSISVDEVDLYRLVADANLFPDEGTTMVEQFIQHIPTVAVYSLLNGEAERFVYAKLATEYGMEPARANARIAQILAARSELFTKIKAAAAAVDQP